MKWIAVLAEGLMDELVLVDWAMGGLWAAAQPMAPPKEANINKQHQQIQSNKTKEREWNDPANLSELSDEFMNQSTWRIGWGMERRRKENQWNWFGQRNASGGKQINEELNLFDWSWLWALPRQGKPIKLFLFFIQQSKTTKKLVDCGWIERKVKIVWLKRLIKENIITVVGSINDIKQMIN